MDTSTTLAASIDITEDKAKYDAACKQLLAERIILAWIMKSTMTGYSISESNIIGEVHEKIKNYDLLTVIMICLGNQNESDEKGLLRLLDVLLSDNTDSVTKKKILSDDFDIPMTQQLERRISNMCNLSEGVYLKGLEKGLERGIKNS